MARIAGMRMVKNKTGKVTHVLLSTKHHGKMLEDMIDAAEMEKARKGDYVSWDEVKQKLSNKFGFKDQ